MKQERVERTHSKNDDKGMKISTASVKKLIKAIFLWAVTIFFALMGLVYLTSGSVLVGVLASAVVVVVIPISGWQGKLKTQIKGVWKPIITILLMIICFAVMGAQADAGTTPPQTTNGGGAHTLEETEGSCIDHDWAAATCTEPKICTRCGEIEGDALGHTWTKATCLSPKTCSTCGETKGSIAKRHTWVDATCMSPKTCSICGKTKGKKAKEHTWVDATCTEAEHCSVCGRDRHWYSLPLGHEWRDATCTEPKTCERCGETEGEPQHFFVSYHWETTEEPTCQTEGEAMHTCKLCGAVETKTLPSVDHKADGWTIIQEATATTRGIRVKLCTMCGTEIDREEYQYIQTSASTGNSTGGGNNFNTYDNEEQQNTTAKYVLNTSTRVFHRPSCRDVPKISPDNYSTTSRTREDLTASGWRSCGHCSP